jgi:hypothetical protein
MLYIPNIRTIFAARQKKEHEIVRLRGLVYGQGIDK